MAVGWLASLWPPILLILSVVTATINCQREVVLLDTTKELELGWTSHESGNPDSNNFGWREGSYLSNGTPVRVYSSCYVISQNVDNWLRTPYIPRGDANSLHIKISFSMRQCSGHSNPSSLQACKETFNLYYYEADSDIANEMMPTWDAMSYQLIEKIAAEKLYVNVNEIKINTVSKEVPLDRGLGGVYFAFQDAGACVALLSIQIYYVLCENITMNYAFFMETPTGDGPRALEERSGVCVANAVQQEQPTYLCKSDGTWYYPKGYCDCKPGFEGIEGKRCEGCKPGHYKESFGNSSCQSCPLNSYTSFHESSECRCVNTYFRSPDDPKNMSCTQPPSEPRALQVIQKTYNSITLQWVEPMYSGGRHDLTYEVECDQCGAGTGVIPGWRNFNQTKVQLTKLDPSTIYTIRIYSQNGVSAVSNQERQYKEVTVTTDSSFATIINVRVIQRGNNFCAIAWDLPHGMQGLISQFEIKWSRLNEEKIHTNYSKSDSFTFKNLQKDAVYLFQVRGFTSKGWGSYSHPPLRVTIGEEQFVEIEAPLPSIGIIIGAVVAVVLCMAIATIMIIILLKRNRNHCSEPQKGAGECDTLHYSHGEVVQCPPLESHLNGGLTMPLFQSPGSVKTYVDPHTYEDPNQAVREFTREIDASHITIESVIGGGEFGDVCKGKLRIPLRPEMTVAIKTLKPGATDKNRLDFLTEASIMGQFDDQNVIFLEGVVTKSHPIMIVTEYMANGSLDTFLRNNDGRFTVIQLVGMMRGIASGMKYLSEMGYVHRDLAARNILVNENLVCKVADFGLSREVDIDTTDGAYTTKGGKIPVRWTAPEAIAFRKFTSASDVWSFGVTMWEVISYGERPYWNWSNQDVIRAVEKGYRLPPPMDCPEATHQLMLDCWQKERGNRPKFAQIVKTLDKLIRAPELLRKKAKPRPDQLVDTLMQQPHDGSLFTSVEGWLVSIKMEKYLNSFLQNGYRTMEAVTTITVRDLEQLGVTLIGHQKKIMNSIQTLRAQMYGPHFQMSEGFLV